MRVVITFAIIIICGFTIYSQSTLYVKHDAVGSNNGTSWANAFNSFQSALDTAVSGDQIWVAKGTYKPSSSYDLTNSPRYYHFRLINGVSIYGGFAGTESAVTERVNFRQGEVNETILSGDLNSNGKDDNDCYHVFYHPSGFDNTAILDGFTIADGNANGASSPHDRGGGIYNNSSSPVLKNLTIRTNSATYGGGIANAGSSPNLTNVIISNNIATNTGGAIYNHSSSPTLNNSVISNNSAIENGGAIFITTMCFPTITNSTIVNNSARNGGVVSFVSNGQVTFKNSVIWGNVASEFGNQFYLNGTSTMNVTLHYSCYSNNTNDIYISNPNGSVTATNNNITSDPQFVDADNGDYRLLGISPCTDAGLNDYNIELTDIRGLPRKLNKDTGAEGIIDLGAYEFKVSTDPLPVELTSFTASVVESKVILNWQTATEVNNYGFEIERSTQPQSNWQYLGFIQGHGNSNSIINYSFIDDNLIDGKYSYRLKQIDNDGNFSYSETLNVEVGDLPISFDLSQNYPNPFNPTTKINFAVPLSASNSFVKLKVYDVTGREITTLLYEQKPSGEYEVVFNGNELSSGVYFYKLTINDFVSTKKLILLK
ncbi:MAG TPA: T9SS type A sorting domain-containing protein [Ignavibacteriaceae bacterium]|nr:T9SS type A sorting domain-containing protein [Ignavibacteriaceae bacterium]